MDYSCTVFYYLGSLRTASHLPWNSISLSFLSPWEQHLTYNVSVTKRFAEIKNWESGRPMPPRRVELPPFRGTVVTPPLIEPAQYVSVVAPTSITMSCHPDLPAVCKQFEKPAGGVCWHEFITEQLSMTIQPIEHLNRYAVSELSQPTDHILYTLIRHAG